MKLTTLCYINHEDKWLFLHRNKKDQDINKGKWIGVGGKFLLNESPDECLVREVQEETGITLTEADYRFRGVITFVYNDQPAEYMHLFTAQIQATKHLECAEGTLAWIAENEIETLNLWQGDRIFLPLLLKTDRCFIMTLVYEDDDLQEVYLDGKKLKTF